MEEPLVTIAVIVYKAADYIEETLDSVKNQTYRNIELIVSDDHSPDNTVEICQNWLKQNENRFAKTKLITVDHNTGVTFNCNRALNSATGYYYGDLAGDDILLPDAVEKYVNYFTGHPEVKFAFGKSIFFYGDFKEQDFHPQQLRFRALCMRDSVTAQKQYHYYQKFYFGNSASYFTTPEVLKSVGGYNEKYPMQEDNALYMALTKSGVKLCCLNEYVVYKRQHRESIMHLREGDELLTKEQVRKFTGEQGFDPELLEQTPYLDAARRFSFWLSKNVIRSGNNRKSIKCLFYNYLRKLFNPFKWFLIWAIIKDKSLNILGY